MKPKQIYLKKKIYKNINEKQKKNKTIKTINNNKQTK
jgi:hypothetical protein